MDLSKNMLTEIPENFGEMVQLKHLDLYSNKVSVIFHRIKLNSMEICVTSKNYLQISRLPLSLGNLKNLKWLDLKENPLAPAVASVAGPCSNASECQTCARKVVTYLANVQLTVEEEKQRRITAGNISCYKLNLLEIFPIVNKIEISFPLLESEKIAANKKEGKKKKKTAEKAKTIGTTEKTKSSDQKQGTEKNETKILKPRETEKKKSNREKGRNVLFYSIFIFLLY